MRRGHLGVRIFNLSRELVKASGLDTTKGGLVNQVDEGGAAKKAGIERGDVIVALDGKPVRNVNELRVRVGHVTPESRAAVEVIRKGKRRTLPCASRETRAQCVPGRLGALATEVVRW